MLNNGFVQLFCYSLQIRSMEGERRIKSLSQAWKIKLIIWVGFQPPRLAMRTLESAWPLMLMLLSHSDLVIFEFENINGNCSSVMNKNILFMLLNLPCKVPDSTIISAPARIAQFFYIVWKQKK